MLQLMRIYGFADEASSDIDEQILAMKRNGLDGLEIRNVDGVNISDITVAKAKEVRKKPSRKYGCVLIHYLQHQRCGRKAHRKAP